MPGEQNQSPTVNLINALNNQDFKAFTQKNDETHKKVTLSMVGDDGKRYFISRVATNEMDGEGKPKWLWARGKAMQNIQS